ncbi:Hemin transport system permease protein HmuU [Parvicella tangerina]|uniref:Hemin transport system permease protein HmuU n=1 Tax=Parvicella tangerina TaxID=2829795 RepID=A0A916JLH4_9FLAO|nr:Hemin transport system permease protein HmuU [Parvicella tangerina]
MLFALLSLILGSEIVAVNDLFSGLIEDNKYRFILMELRLPRVLTAVLAGAALAVAGLLMQSFFRNPLAGPYILGVSAGSGLGVALLILFGSSVGWKLVQMNNGVMLFSVLGAAGVLGIILYLAKKIGNGAMLLIAGLMVGAFASAVVSVLQFFAPSESIKKYLLWTMGNLSAVEMSEMFLFALLTLGFIAFSFFKINPLNALLLGDQAAQSLGVDVKKTRFTVILIAGVLAGVVTAYCGPVAFIGLAAPHLSRLIAKTSDHRTLIPLSALLGALLLVVCDMVAQVPGFDLLLPINAVTSLVGAPLVISIILNNRKTWLNE